MKKVIAVNGSPRGKKSNSMTTLKIIHQELSGEFEWNNISIKSNTVPTKKFLESEILLISYPLYVDGLPSGLIKWLEEYRRIALEAKSVQTVYAAANCGFYEGEQNRHSLKMIEAFAISSRLKWGGGIGIGTGEMITAMKEVPPQAGIRRPVFEIMKKLSNALESESPLAQNLYAHHGFPRILYKVSGEAGWRKKARLQGLNRKDLFAKPLV